MDIGLSEGKVTVNKLFEIVKEMDNKASKGKEGIC